MEEQKPKKPLNKFLQFSSMVFQMIAVIVAGTYIGTKLDQRYPNNHQIFTVILSIVFVSAYMFLIIKKIIKNLQNDE